jgi:hypothetical protein
MCDCIKEIDSRLDADGQCLNASLFGTRRVAIGLIRTDKWTAETRRNKPKLMVATFCPFCGDEYARADAGAQTEDSANG